MVSLDASLFCNARKFEIGNLNTEYSEVFTKLAEKTLCNSVLNSVPSVVKKQYVPSSS